MGTYGEGHSKQGLEHGSSSTDTRPRPVMPDSSARCQPTVTSQDTPREGHETFQLWGVGVHSLPLVPCEAAPITHESQR